ncbi:MAG: glycosyltransferase family A protein [Planctomycetota bacterium]
MPEVSVVIPHYNDVDRLRLCLACLAEQEDAPAFEVVVADNGSEPAHDPSGVVGEFGFARLVVEEKPGSYAARNAALRTVDSPVVAFTDSDCLPEPGWLRAGYEAVLAQAEPRGLVAGHIEVFPVDAARPSGVELYDMLLELRQRMYVEQERFGATANVFTTSEVLGSVGVFDGGLKSYGDVEWGQRVDAAGRPLEYAAGVVVRHPARSSLSAMIRKRRRQVGGEFDRGQAGVTRAVSWGMLGLLWKNTVGVLPKAWALGADPRVEGLCQRLRLFTVYLRVHFARLLERVRKRLGGSSERE